jgi:hypothetical protein
LNFFLQNRTFAVTDDYRLIRMARDLTPFVLEGHARDEVSTGRLIPGIFFKLIWLGVNGIENLWYVRLLGIFFVAIAVAAFLIWFATVAGLVSRLSYFILAVTGTLAMFLPGIAATTTWATKTAHLLALPFAMAGGILAAGSRPTPIRWSLITLLIFCSVFSYQHFAMLATLPVCVMLALRHNDEVGIRPFIRLLSVASIGLSAVLVNVAFVRVLESDVLDRISNRSLTNRLKELVDVAAKASLLYVDRSVSLVMASGVVFCGVVLPVLLLRPRAWKLLVGIAISTMCSTFLTFGGDGESSFRMVLPTQLTLWLGLGVLAAFGLSTRDTQPHWSFVIIPIVFSGALLLALLNTGAVIRNDIAGRNARDWVHTKCQVKRLLDSGVREKSVVQLIPVELSGPNSVRSEIGLMASHVDWLFLDQWSLAIDESDYGNLLAQVPIHLSYNDPTSVVANPYVIDLRKPCSSSTP